MIAGDTRQPLRGVRLTLRNQPNTGFLAFLSSDEQGRFEFPNLAPQQQYVIEGEKAGYVSLAYGQRRPGLTPIPMSIRAGESRDVGDLVLPRAGAVVVHVTDDFGGGVGRVHVQLLQARFTNGERTLGSVVDGYTDDAGDARLPNIVPGEYYLAAGSDAIGRRATMLNRSDSGLRYARATYYPATATLAEAQRLIVPAAQDTFTTIQLAVVKTVHLAGVVRSSDGGPVPALTSIVLAPASSPIAGETFPVQPDGRFDWPSVIPGQYVATPPGRRAFEFLSLPLTVTGDDTDLTITTTKGTDINGQLVFDDYQAPSRFELAQQEASLAVSFVGGLSTSSGRPAWHDDGTFTIAEQAGTGVFRLGPPAARAGWFLKSVTFRGVDVTDVLTDAARLRSANDLRVVVTRARTEVSGTVVDGRGASMKDFTVIAFPDDRALRRGRTRHVLAAHPDGQGRFTLAALPPGQYRVIALDWLEPGEEFDTDFLQTLEPAAAPLTLGDNESKSLTLRLVAR